MTNIILLLITTLAMSVAPAAPLAPSALPAWICRIAPIMCR